MYILLAIIFLSLIFKKNISKIFSFLEKQELHHKFLVFVGMIVFTILFVRIGVMLYDPNPFIFGFELHHFDYGILMMVSLMIMLLFDKTKARYPLYLLLSAVSLGLTIDQWYFVRSQDLASGLSSVTLYNNTGDSVIFLFFFIVLITIFVNHKKRKSNVQKS